MKRPILITLASCLFCSSLYAAPPEKQNNTDCYQVLFMAGATVTIIDEGDNHVLPQSKADIDFDDLVTADLSDIVLSSL